MTSNSIACEETPALNLQIIFRKLASSAMQYLLTSKLSNEKVDMKRTIEVNRPSTKHLLNNFLGQFFRKA